MAISAIELLDDWNIRIMSAVFKLTELCNSEYVLNISPSLKSWLCFIFLMTLRVIKSNDYKKRAFGDCFITLHTFLILLAATISWSGGYFSIFSK